MHVPFEIVQRKRLFPIESPETLVLARFALPKVAVPEITVQSPVPKVGVLPETVEVVAQTVWSIPASETVGFSSTRMVISSKESVQVPLEMVQRKTLFPTESPDTLELARVSLLKVAVPEITDQSPVPIAGELAESEALVEQIVWSEPASAVVGFSST